jgi:uncharacterized surface protein with fasciclin (FAS1) repeats
LLTLIETAGLGDAARGAWTLFAPNNAKLEKLDHGLNSLTSPAGKDDLIEILKYHAIPQVFTSES